VNEENNEANNIKNRLSNDWGKVPDVARYYKVKKTEMIYQVMEVDFFVI
jgi:hypothetical protein